MKNKCLFSFLIVFCFLAADAFAQASIVVNDPTTTGKPAMPSAAEENIIKRSVLPTARKIWTDDICLEEFEIAGAVKGSFTRAGAKQTLIFYKFCLIGNGFGHNGLVLMENGRITASYGSKGSRALDIKALPDINRNGLNEFAVYYSGEMQYGEGGSGVDILEFSRGGAIKGIGWFQADMYGEVSGDYGYKVTVKTGRTPVFYREKYMVSPSNKWRKAGKIAQFKLGRIFSEFSLME
jgi:hypothetical protein